MDSTLISPHVIYDALSLNYPPSLPTFFLSAKTPGCPLNLPLEIYRILEMLFVTVTYNNRVGVALYPAHCMSQG